MNVMSWGLSFIISGSWIDTLMWFARSFLLSFYPYFYSAHFLLCYIYSVIIPMKSHEMAARVNRLILITV